MHKYYVLTAAHCVNERLHSVHFRNRYISILIDDSSDDIAYLEGNPITEIIIHENYSQYSQGQRNDIALLRTENLSVEDHVPPICLPIKDDLRYKDFDGESLIVAAWKKNANG